MEIDTRLVKKLAVKIGLEKAKDFHDIIELKSYSVNMNTTEFYHRGGVFNGSGSDHSGTVSIDLYVSNIDALNHLIKYFLYPNMDHNRSKEIEKEVMECFPEEFI